MPPFPVTETALFAVHEYAIRSEDKGKVTTLILLDLSAALDTVTGGVGRVHLHRL